MSHRNFLDCGSTVVSPLGTEEREDRRGVQMSDEAIVFARFLAIAIGSMVIWWLWSAFKNARKRDPNFATVEYVEASRRKARDRRLGEDWQEPGLNEEESQRRVKMYRVWGVALVFIICIWFMSETIFSDTPSHLRGSERTAYMMFIVGIVSVVLAFGWRWRFQIGRATAGTAIDLFNRIKRAI